MRKPCAEKDKGLERDKENALHQILLNSCYSSKIYEEQIKGHEKAMC